MSTKNEHYQKLPDKEKHNISITMSTTGMETPLDRYSVVYMIMVLIGAGLLFPYNAIITAAGYFQNVYPNYRFEYYVPFVMNGLSPLVQYLIVLHGHKISFTVRIAVGFTIESIFIIPQMMARR